MARLTEEMVIARSRQSDLASVKKLNCWGAELSDVSLLQRMPNVEVLALSLNKIRTLSDFAHLSRLRELYVRKNEVGALSEVRHLRRLPLLTALWLEENPCAARADYRHTVLRNLPQLTRLDDRPVLPDELEEAQRRGVLYAHDDDEPDEEPERDDWRPPTPDGEPRRLHDPSAEWPDDGEPERYQPPPPQAESPPRRAGGYSPDSDERYEHPAGAALTRSYHERSSGGGYGGSEDERGGGGGGGGAPLRHSVSAHSVKVGGWGWPGGGGSAPSGGCMCVCVSQEYAATNGDAPASAAAGRPPSLCSPPSYHQHHHDAYYERPDRLESCSARGGADAWERESERERERPREFASAVMAEHRGFTRRPVTRNSNLLSAVLCLVKELDYASLEVAEMAVRCRMDELAHGP